jgi:hypothetical protein
MGGGRTVPKAAMPDLPALLPPLSSLAAVARLALVVYATLATILTTACLTLHAIAAFDRRFAQRAPAGQVPRSATRRPLFVPLEAEAES